MIGFKTRHDIQVISNVFITLDTLFELITKRTSDSLNEGLPIKMTREKFQRKRYFSMKEIVGSTLSLSTKAVFSLDKYQLKIWVENSVFAIQHIENKKLF